MAATPLRKSKRAARAVTRAVTCVAAGDDLEPELQAAPRETANR